MNQVMQFDFIAIGVGVFALVILYLAYRLLASSSWVMGWIQGNLGLALLLLTGVLVLAIVDIRSYRPMFDDTPIATISLHTLGPGNHQLRLVDSEGIEQGYVINGDQYQLVIHQFKWATRFAGMGLGHGYRVDHLVAIDNTHKTKVPVSASGYVDVWRFFYDYLPQDFFVSAAIVETEPRKVVDGAMYELTPEAFDLYVTPLNQVAKAADTVTAAEGSAPVDASVTTAPVATVPVTEVPVTPAPATQTPVTQAVPAAPVTAPVAVPAAPAPAPKPKVQEMPGAHIQATPATVIEKPADQKTN